MSPRPSGAVASARRRFALPAEWPLDRLRVLLLRVLWLNLAAVIPMLVFAHASAWELRLAAGVLTVAIGAHCARAVRRGSLPLPTLVPEALALLSVGILAGPVAVNGALWCVLLFRSLYTPTRKAVIPAATTGLVLSAVFLLSPESHGQWAGTIAPELPGFFVLALIMSSLAMSLKRQEIAVARERVLSDAGADLVSPEDIAQVGRVAVAAALKIAPGSRASLWLGDERSVRMVAVEGDASEDAAGAMLDIEGAPAEARERLLNGWPIDETMSLPVRLRLFPKAKRGGLLGVPLMRGGKLRGLLAVGSDSALPRGCEDSFTTLAHHVALAVESLGLTDELRRREERFRAMVQSASDLVAVVDRKGRSLYASPSHKRLLGYTPEQLRGFDTLERIVHPDDREGVRAFFSQAVKRGEITPAVCWRVRHSDGGWRYLETICHNLEDDPNVAGILLTSRDIGERKELEDRLLHRAFHDALTGLPNRALFSDRVEHALARHVREGGRVAVLFIDLDDFKTVNDSLGHAAGDQLLVEVAARLRKCLRGADTPARLGGDEFAILLEELEDPREAAGVAQRLIEGLRPPFELEGRKTFVYASIGIAMSQAGDLRSEELLRNADLAMYIAKRRGKGRYEYFEPAMHLAALERLDLKAELEQALERRQFVIHYQPFVDLATRRITAVEALVRWQHPERGIVPPLDFIPLAEETGLIVRIGGWVLREACRQARQWQQLHPSDPPLAVGVNLSGRQLQDDEIVDDVREALGETGLPATSLILEITETVLLHDAEAANETLKALKRLGVRLAIDDFGTGYSSLSYLDSFPMDIVKIAKPFIDGIALGSDGSAVAAAMIALGGTLGLQTVAEGIEHAAQLAELRALSCDQGQGFYLARPLPPEELEGLLSAGPLPAADGVEASP